MDINKAFRPSTDSAHRTHLKTYISFLIHLRLPMDFQLSSIIAFMKYLNINSISPQVIQTYISSLRTMAAFFGLPHSLSHYSVQLMLRSLRINSTVAPRPKGIFSLQQLQQISRACEGLHDPVLFRAAFLVAYFGLFRLSNIAPILGLLLTPLGIS